MTPGAPGPDRGPRGGARPGAGLTPAARDAILDAYFDGEMDEASRAAFLDTLRSDHALAGEFARMTFVLDSLSRPVLAPDLSREILAEASRRTRGGVWISARTRAWVRVGRLAAAACLLLALGVALLARRAAPERFIDRPAPLTAVVERGRTETAGALLGVAGAYDAAKDAARRLGAVADARPIVSSRPALRDADAVAVAYPAPASDAADGPEYLALAWTSDRPPVATPRAVWRRSEFAALSRGPTPPAPDR